MAAKHFKVELKQMETIPAALPIQERYLPLTNLDLLLPQLDVSTFFCYKHITNDIDTNLYPSFSSKVGVLKKSLAQTLVMYFPFAGEISLNSAGEPELLCNNRGVDFLTMYADVDLSDLNLHNPDESIEGNMVPFKKNGTLAVQVTELRCGSMIVGCTFDHRVADAYSMNMFLVSWAEMAQSKPVSLQPNFQRSFFRPRSPVNFNGQHPSVDRLYATISSLPPPPQSPSSSSLGHRLASRIYVVPSAQLHLLQSIAAAESGINISKLVSFSSFLWKLIAKCDSDNKKDELMTRLGIVVNGRSRLVNKKSTTDDDVVNEADTMKAYFGNVLTIPYGEEKVGVMGRDQLGRTSEKVSQFLTVGTTKDHFLNLIDWVEVHRPEAAMARVYCTGTGDESALVVSCGREFPAREVDYGWGRPWIGSYHFPWGGETGYVMPMPSPTRNGDWVVYMHLRAEQLKVVEREAGDMFKPLTKEYLDSVV